MKYMLLLNNDARDWEAWRSLSPEEAQAAREEEIPKWNELWAWMEQQGVRSDGLELGDPAKARVVRIRDGETIVYAIVATGGGSVINVSSVAGLVGWRMLPAYAGAAAVDTGGASATSNPPSSSYAGKTSTVTVLTCPERDRSSNRSPMRRTPHSRAIAAGFRPCSKPPSPNASTTSLPISSLSRYPVSSKTPRPAARIRPFPSQATSPADGAG